MSESHGNPADKSSRAIPGLPASFCRLVYDELRKLAAQRPAKQPGQTLQATALVHEAWLRLGGRSTNLKWENRAHFFAAAAEAMRRILIDNARCRKAVRHGGNVERVPLDGLELAAGVDDEQLLAVHEALDSLAAHDAVKAELVKLRFFVGPDDRTGGQSARPFRTHRQMPLGLRPGVVVSGD